LLRKSAIDGDPCAELSRDRSVVAILLRSPNTRVGLAVVAANFIFYLISLTAACSAGGDSPGTSGNGGASVGKDASDGKGGADNAGTDNDGSSSEASAPALTFFASPHGSGASCTLAAPCDLRGVQTRVRIAN